MVGVVGGFVRGVVGGMPGILSVVVCLSIGVVIIFGVVMVRRLLTVLVAGVCSVTSRVVGVVVWVVVSRGVMEILVSVRVVGGVVLVVILIVMGGMVRGVLKRAPSILVVTLPSCERSVPIVFRAGSSSMVRCSVTVVTAPRRLFTSFLIIGCLGSAEVSKPPILPVG